MFISSEIDSDRGTGLTERGALLLPRLAARVRQRGRLDGFRNLRGVARGALGALLASARRVGPGAHLDLVVGIGLGRVVFCRRLLDRLLDDGTGLALAADLLRQGTRRVRVAGLLFLGRFVAVRLHGLLD